MDRTLLRKLAWKSKLGFGQYADMTVRDISIYCRSYLAYIYYNCDMIDFIDEIKAELQLIEIPKPGKAPERKNEWLAKVGESMTDEQRAHYWMSRKAGRKRAAKAALAHAERDERRSTYKGVMQARNHGRLK